MKLRGKLVLLESMISLIFFLSLLISLTLLNRGFKFYDFIDECRRINHLTQQMTTHMEILLYLQNPSDTDKSVIWDELYTEMSLKINNVYTNRFLDYYGTEIIEEMDQIKDIWQIAQTEYFPSGMIRRFQEMQQLKGEHQLESYSLFQLYTLWEPYQDDQLETWQLEIMETARDYLTFFDLLETMYNDTSVFSEKVLTGKDIIQSRQLNGIFIFSIITVIVAFVIMLAYLRRLLGQIGFIRNALDQVTKGDLSARLRIQSNDEFGKLSRDFNTVIEVLWSKLETVQNILEDVGKSISNEINLERAEKAILYLARKNSSADGVAYYKIRGESALSIAHVQGSYHPPFIVEGKEEENIAFTNNDELLDSYKEYPVPLEGNILGDTARNGEAIFLKDAPRKQIWNRSENHHYYISSLINLPLRVGDRVLGVLSLTKNRKGETFSDLEFTNMLSFAELASISIDNLLKYQEMLEVYELNREIDIAAEIQKDLLPQEIPAIPGLGMAVNSRTLRGINGDFYDTYLLSNSKLLMAICEVAGKGVPAALVIIMLKTILKLVARPEKSASEIITELNRNITERIKIENIATLSLMVIDTQTNQISYGSAGHQPMLIYNMQNKEITEIKPNGIPVGLDKNAEYEGIEIQLEEDSIYLQYTDGIPETLDRDGKIYGISGIKKILDKFSDQSAETIKSEILDDLEFFQRDTQQWDDQTLLVMKKEILK